MSSSNDSDCVYGQLSANYISLTLHLVKTVDRFLTAESLVLGVEKSVESHELYLDVYRLEHSVQITSVSTILNIDTVVLNDKDYGLTL